MSEKVTAQIGGGRTIEFANSQDALLFTAHFGTEMQFRETYKQVYKSVIGAGRLYQYLIRRPQTEIWEMMKRTPVSDGSTLLEAIRKETEK